jgi:hypothetical protein
MQGATIGDHLHRQQQTDERIERQVRARRQTRHVAHNARAQTLANVDAMRRDQRSLKTRLGGAPV